MNTNYHQLVEYEPPFWAKNIIKRPKKRYILAHVPTPIHLWNYSGFSGSGFQVIIKRDDMSGSTLSGNKVRKLEFLLADAKEKKADVIITTGGIDKSNHCRATAIAARELGFESLLLLFPTGDDRREELLKEGKQTAAGLSGNYFLDILVGAQCRILPRGTISQYFREIDRIVQEEREKSEKNIYFIPAGGSNSIGLWGYIECVREFLEQGIEEVCDDLVFSTGSGGTAAGLAIGLYLAKSKIRLHGFVVVDFVKTFYEHIDRAIRDIFPEEIANQIHAKDLIHFHNDYRGRGYAMPEKEELHFIKDIAQETGILLDPVYTGRAAYGMYQEILKAKESGFSKFKGNRILFLHTGGIFGNFDTCMLKDMSDIVPL